MFGKILKFIMLLIVVSMCFDSSKLMTNASLISESLDNSPYKRKKSIHTNEWVNSDGFYFYYGPDGERIMDCWCEIGGEWYCFDGAGKMLQSKWITDDIDLYYVGIDGIMYKSKWLLDNGKWYYFDGEGKLVKSQWIQNQYYVDSEGAMLKDTTRTINGKTYIFDSNGKSTEKINNTSYSTNQYSSFGDTTSSSSSGLWYTKSGSCYHEKKGCSGATIPYPPKNKNYRPCSKCCR